MTLLDKPSRREEGGGQRICAGFVVPDEFVVGYGLDYAQLYRNLPYIGVLKPDVYDKHLSMTGRCPGRCGNRRSRL